MTDQMAMRTSLGAQLRDTAASLAPEDGRRAIVEDAAAALSGTVKVQGRCPGCGSTTLFVGNGGYITCSLATCPDPTAAHELLASGTNIKVTDEGFTLSKWIQGSTSEGPVGAVGKPPAQYVGKGGLQPFDIIDAFDLDFYEGNAMKYLLRWRKKNGLEDLRKAAHYIQEVIAHAE